MSIESMKTAELVALYNEHAESPIKKFSDRKTAIRRVTELMATVKPKKKAKAKKEVNAIPADRSAAIANSWNVPETRIKRSQRTAISMGGHEYPSVASVFRAMDWPANDIIKTRMICKRDGVVTYQGKTLEEIKTNY